MQKKLTCEAGLRPRYVRQRSLQADSCCFLHRAAAAAATAAVQCLVAAALCLLCGRGVEWLVAADERDLVAGTPAQGEEISAAAAGCMGGKADMVARRRKGLLHL
jgi:hypothetical protein